MGYYVNGNRSKPPFFPFLFPRSLALFKIRNAARAGGGPPSSPLFPSFSFLSRSVVAADRKQYALLLPLFYIFSKWTTVSCPKAVAWPPPFLLFPSLFFSLFCRRWPSTCDFSALAFPFFSFLLTNRDCLWAGSSMHGTWSILPLPSFLANIGRNERPRCDHCFFFPLPPSSFSPRSVVPKVRAQDAKIPTYVSLPPGSPFFLFPLFFFFFPEEFLTGSRDPKCGDRVAEKRS